MDDRSRHLRSLIVDSFEASAKGHVGASMSMVEILRVLYDDFLRFRTDDPSWSDRDRFILSKGHGCVALYAMLADKGFIGRDELLTVSKAESRLGGHPEAGDVPGIELSTGSLGHGLSVGVGLALAARMQNRESRVVVLTGDGELNEGSIWEAVMSAAHHKLGNLSVFIDYNKMQSYGDLTDVISPQDMCEKWRAFGFTTVEVDGHDIKALRAVVNTLRDAGEKPTAVVCHTVKGKGISLAENEWDWHFRFGFSEEELQSMRNDLIVGTNA